MVIVATVVLIPGSKFTFMFLHFNGGSDYTCILLFSLGWLPSSLSTRPNISILLGSVMGLLILYLLSLASPEFGNCPLKNYFLSWHKLYQYRRKWLQKLAILLIYNFNFVIVQTVSSTQIELSPSSVVTYAPDSISGLTRYCRFRFPPFSRDLH